LGKYSGSRKGEVYTIPCHYGFSAAKTHLMSPRTALEKIRQLGDDGGVTYLQ
jgi:hypothetical protein